MRSSGVRASAESRRFVSYVPTIRQQYPTVVSDIPTMAAARVSKIPIGFLRLRRWASAISRWPEVAFHRGDGGECGVRRVSGRFNRIVSDIPTRVSAVFKGHCQRYPDDWEACKARPRYWGGSSRFGDFAIGFAGSARAVSNIPTAICRKIAVSDVPTITIEYVSNIPTGRWDGLCQRNPDAPVCGDAERRENRVGIVLEGNSI